eukprot:3960574-Pleurochrysis_carterae.AAC.7
MGLLLCSLLPVAIGCHLLDWMLSTRRYSSRAADASLIAGFVCCSCVPDEFWPQAAGLAAHFREAILKLPSLSKGAAHEAAAATHEAVRAPRAVSVRADAHGTVGRI